MPYIGGTTRLAGLIGYPVRHTLSPQMHNAGFRQANLDYIYLAFEVPPDGLNKVIRALIPLGFIGINVTVPYKQVVMKLLDEISEEAKIIGAVNTILIRDNKLKGYNTDGIGFVSSLRKDHRISVKGKRIFLLGAGGAGHAVGVQSVLEGAELVFIYDINQRKAKGLKNRIKRAGGGAVIVEKNSMESYIEDSDIIVNATPLGLHPDDPLPVEETLIPSGKIVYDLIYNPPKTRFLEIAERKGSRIINGLGMLLYQGVTAWERWTGRKAPVGAMRKALRDAIERGR